MGKIITIFGHTGKSTVATNLAIALAKKDAVVGIIGANLSYPSLPAYFGMKIEPEKSLKRALDTRIEDDIVKNFSQHPKLKNLFILSLANANDALTFSGDISEADAERLLLNTKDNFNYLIIDATSNYRQVLTFLAMIHSDKIVNIVTQDLQGMLFQLAHNNLFNKLNFDSKVISVMNMYDNSVSTSDIEKNINRKIDVILPYSKSVTESVNTSNPITLEGASNKTSNKYINAINDLTNIIENDGTLTEIKKNKFSIFHKKEV